MQATHSSSVLKYVGVFVALSVAAVGAFWYWVARDAQESIEERRAQVAVLDKDIQRGLTTAKRLPEFRREVQQLEAQLDRLRAVLPEEQDVIRRPRQAAREVGDLDILAAGLLGLQSPHQRRARNQAFRQLGERELLNLLQGDHGHLALVVLQDNVAGAAQQAPPVLRPVLSHDDDLLVEVLLQPG